MNNNLIYLDTYVLQQDMRIRMPKSILANLNIEKGKAKFNIYFDKMNSCLVLKVDEAKPEDKR
ncbi:MAG: AbrB/MazE/SpoVT family DNA-binding domain-containing protein [Clostridium sp.]|nr:AbrB/MazE/SpoVT family DNA-binding domain-containing protein [Clostridium sp.]